MTTVESHDSLDSAVGQGAINQLATHLPNQVVYADHTQQLPFQTRFQGILMFLDISGFTALCEKFSMNARHGTDQLTRTLNDYMSALVSEVTNNDGDILKFAGDAILTLWKAENFTMMRATVPHVIKCAMGIQERCGEYITSVGVKLKVKVGILLRCITTNPILSLPLGNLSADNISLQHRKLELGIAAGEVNITFLGNNEFCHYVTLGRAVESVRQAEKFCKSGDVVVSPSAWCHCQGLETEHELCEDNKHINVTSVLTSRHCSEYVFVNTMTVTASLESLLESEDFLPSTMALDEKEAEAPPAPPQTPLGVQQRISLRRPSASFLSGLQVDKQIKDKVDKQIKDKRSSISSSQVRSKPVGTVEKDSKRAAKQGDKVRSAVIDQVEPFVVSNLKLYVAVPVLRKLEERQPLEYLSEMRQCSVVFINLSLDECTSLHMCLTLQACFDVIYSNTKQSSGCLNKIFMFDKGCTFLVIFGLPGFKHENDCAHALKCASRMKAELDVITNILVASIGVTTGSSFCGVVGHPHRHEYTVIGRKVNMAARLMMYYPGKVTCDNETFHHSKMNKGHFMTVEIKELKGLTNVGVIREYKPSASGKDDHSFLFQQEEDTPLIGRSRELKIFHDELMKVANDNKAAAQRQVLVFEGEPGIGKTRMLEAAMVSALKEKMRVFTCSLSMQDAKTPYYAVKSLLMDLLELDLEMTHQERQNSLYQKIKDPFSLQHMALLNDILHIKFQISDTTAQLTAKKHAELLSDLLHHLVRETCEQKGFATFFIDDGHFMDPDSWDFVRVLGLDMRSLVVMNLRMPFPMCTTAVDVLTAPTTLHISLRGIDPSYLTTLACQILGVTKIPNRLNALLQARSHGVPTWVEHLLRHMFYENVLRIETLCVTDDDPEPMTNTSAKRKLQKSSVRGSDVMKQMNRIKSNLTELVCVIAPGQSLEVGIPDSIMGMVQARIDRMEELDQTIIKVASILGMTFQRVMLQATLPRPVPEEKMSEAIQRLADCGIFVCACAQIGSRKLSQGNLSGMSLTRASSGMVWTGKGMKNVTCFCPLRNCGPVEKPMHECQFVSFHSSSIQETAYDMFLEEPRRVLHIKAAHFLESQAHKCGACGGGDFLTHFLLRHGNLHDDAQPVSGTTENQAASKLHDIGMGVSQKLDRSFRSTRRGRLSGPSPINTAMLESQTTVSAGRRISLGAAMEGFERKHQSKHKALNKILRRNPDSEIGSKEPPASETSERGQIDAQQIILALENSGKSSDGETAGLHSLDLRECQCMQILSSVYPQLVRHWKAAGDIKRTLHFFMEAAAAALTTCDNMQALSYLKQMRSILDALKRKENPFEGDVANVTIPTLQEDEEQRMECLTGKALFYMGQIDEAMPHFKAALRQYGVTIPKGIIRTRINLWLVSVQLWKHRCFPNRYIGIASTMDSMKLMEQVECLLPMRLWYLHNEQIKHAVLVAKMQISKAEKADSDMHELVMACASMIETCQMLGWIKMAKHYDFKAQLRCIGALHNLTADNLVTMTHLYRTLLNMRLVQASIDEAIDAGYTASTLAEKLHDRDMAIKILPVFIMSLLLANRLVDAVDALNSLEYIVDATDDICAEAWYNALCMDLILDTGFQLQHAFKCVEFVALHKNTLFGSCSRNAVFYITSCVALWHQRNMEENEGHELCLLSGITEPSLVLDVMTGRAFLNLLEIKLLQLAQCIGQNDALRLPAMKATIKKEMKKLKQMVKHLPVLQPRLHHLRAYHAAIQRHNKLAKYWLLTCLSQCEKTSNFLDAHWANHSYATWFEAGSKKEHEDYWTKHAKLEMYDWHMAGEVDQSNTRYSLPLPSWFS